MRRVMFICGVLTIVIFESSVLSVISIGVPKHSLRETVSSYVIQALRSERLRKGLSMNRVAEHAGLHVSMISLVERELRKPTLDTLLRIAEALDVDLGALIQRASKSAKRISKP